MVIWGYRDVSITDAFLGNFIADVTRNVTQADIALINSGTLRSDMIHPAGEFKMKVSRINKHQPI